jgi:hypothetical protein
MKDKELCWLCDTPTGRAGRAEDSLYSKTGFGPYCEECWSERPTSAAREAKAEGIKRVTENAGPAFAIQVRALVRAYLPGRICTGETIKHDAIAKGIKPHHHNAWGGIMQGITRSGMLQETGRWPQATSTQSHARRLPEYVRTEL